MIVTVLNINTGNVHISLPEDPENTGKTGRGRNGSKYYMEDTSATGSDGSNPWGSVVIIWILTSDFLFQSDRGTVCLGISSGAKMMVALAMIFFLERYAFVSSYTLIVAAFIGALISTGFILLLSRKMKHMATLLVGGIMIGYICSAITDFVVTFAEDSDIVNLHGWSQGELFRNELE